MSVARVGTAVAQRQHQRHPLGVHPPRYERKGLCGCRIQPLRIVHQAQQRPFLGDFGQQIQTGKPDQEAVRRVPGTQPERHTQGGLLRFGQRTQPVQQRRT